MILGQVIRAVQGGTSTYYSPWFPRLGTRAVFACNPIGFSEVEFLKIKTQTRKAEDENLLTTTIKDVGAAEMVSLASADSVHTFLRGNPIDGSGSGQGFLDLVRFVYEVKSNSSKRGWVHFRMLDPTWETD
jgi:hypothetical protein